MDLQQFAEKSGNLSTFKGSIPAPALRTLCQKVRPPKCLGVEEWNKASQHHSWIALAGPIAVNIFRKLAVPFWVLATSQSLDHWNLFTALWNWRYCSQEAACRMIARSNFAILGVYNIKFQIGKALLFCAWIHKEAGNLSKPGTSAKNTYTNSFGSRPTNVSLFPPFHCSLGVSTGGDQLVKRPKLRHLAIIVFSTKMALMTFQWFQNHEVVKKMPFFKWVSFVAKKFDSMLSNRRFVRPTKSGSVWSSRETCWL